jgi:hypothetical protein
MIMMSHLPGTQSSIEKLLLSRPRFGQTGRVILLFIGGWKKACSIKKIMEHASVNKECDYKSLAFSFARSLQLFW